MREKFFSMVAQVFKDAERLYKGTWEWNPNSGFFWKNQRCLDDRKYSGEDRFS